MVFSNGLLFGASADAGGGGGSFFGTPYATGSGGNGGSGTVIIRYKYQN